MKDNIKTLYHGQVERSHYALTFADDIVAYIKSTPGEIRGTIAGRLLLSIFERLLFMNAAFSLLGKEDCSFSESVEARLKTGTDDDLVASVSALYLPMILPVVSTALELTEQVFDGKGFRVSYSRQPLLAWRTKQLYERAFATRQTLESQFKERSDSSSPRYFGGNTREKAEVLAGLWFAEEVQHLALSATPEGFFPSGVAVELIRLDPSARRLLKLIDERTSSLAACRDSFFNLYLQAVTGFIEDTWQAADEVLVKLVPADSASK